MTLLNVQATKSYAPDFTLNVRVQIDDPGPILITGRNGAGKTTLLRLVTGMAVPDEGSSYLLGERMHLGNVRLKQEIACAWEEPRFMPQWKLSSLLDWTRKWYPTWDRQTEQELLSLWRLHSEKKFGELSAGQKKKAALLMALAKNTRVLVLDEPAAHLDEESIDWFCQVLPELTGRRDSLALIASHNPGILGNIIADRLVMEDGTFVADASSSGEYRSPLAQISHQDIKEGSRFVV